MKFLLLVLLTGLLFSCGKVTQEQAVTGEATITIRLEVAFPTCESLEGEDLLECVKNAKIAIEAAGFDLSAAQIEALAAIEKAVNGGKEDENDEEDAGD